MSMLFVNNDFQGDGKHVQRPPIILYKKINFELYFKNIVKIIMKVRFSAYPEKM